MIDLDSYAHVRSALRLTSFAECEEALVSPSIRTGSFEDESAPFKLGTIFELDGDAHQQHRRLAAPLFAKSALAFYEKNLLVPAIQRCLTEVTLDRDGRDVLRTDLVQLVRRMMVRIAATIIGLDGTDNLQRTEALLAHADALGAGADVKWSNRTHAEVIAEGLKAKAEFVREFYDPSTTHRLVLMAAVEDGRLAHDQLPTDLITLMHLQDAKVWKDDQRLREVIVYLTAGIRTTASAVTHTVNDLHDWLAANPADAGRLQEADFLRGASNEAIRLHPSSPALVREAVADFRFRSGRRVSAGTRLALDLYSANRDRSIYGPDAEMFNPHRETERRYPPYGLSFGAGPHLCVGKPLVTTTVAAKFADGYEMFRSIVRILKALYAAGIEPDPDRKPLRAPTAQDRYELYPVLFLSL